MPKLVGGTAGAVVRMHASTVAAEVVVRAGIPGTNRKDNLQDAAAVRVLAAVVYVVVIAELDVSMSEGAPARTANALVVTP